MLSTVVNHMVY